MEESKARNNLYEMLQVVYKERPIMFGAGELHTLKAFIHGYLQALFQNKIEETSFPKYRWFSDWVNGRIETEYKLGYAWDTYILSLCKGNQKEGMALFFKLYEEFMQSEIVCSYQRIGSEKKIFRDAPHGDGVSWQRANDVTASVLLFELLPSRTAWGLFLTDQNTILHSTCKEDRLTLIDNINTNYFALKNEDWTRFDGNFFLRNMILNNPENNY